MFTGGKKKGHKEGILFYLQQSLLSFINCGMEKETLYLATSTCKRPLLWFMHVIMKLKTLGSHMRFSCLYVKRVLSCFV